MDKGLLEKLEKMATAVCEKTEVALYDLELKRAAKGLILLIYINRLGGVSIENCQKVSRLLSDLLDESELIGEHYFLEVSSPGLERELKLKKHYASAIGEDVKITFSTEDGNKTLIGAIRGLEADVLIVETEDNVVEIRFNDIKKAKTYFDYKKKK
jgi:ribosome maturation factor RimP